MYHKMGYNIYMYKVTVLKKAEKAIRKMPLKERQRFDVLKEDLQESGPVQPDWANYSKLSDTEHHCHLSYSWVACWYMLEDEINIEVYYVGSRENAPY